MRDHRVEHEALFFFFVVLHPGGAVEHFYLIAPRPRPDVKPAMKPSSCPSSRPLIAMVHRVCDIRHQHFETPTLDINCTSSRAYECVCVCVCVGIIANFLNRWVVFFIVAVRCGASFTRSIECGRDTE